MVTRLGLYGGSRAPYGDFTGKAEQAKGGVRRVIFKDVDPIWKQREQSKELDWVDKDIKKQLKRHKVESFDVSGYLDEEIKKEFEIQNTLRKKRRKKKALDMLLRSL